jgi:hypothetical protein
MAIVEKGQGRKEKRQDKKERKEKVVVIAKDFCIFY